MITTSYLPSFLKVRTYSHLVGGDAFQTLGDHDRLQIVLYGGPFGLHLMYDVELQGIQIGCHVDDVRTHLDIQGISEGVGGIDTHDYRTMAHLGQTECGGRGDGSLPHSSFPVIDD